MKKPAAYQRDQTTTAIQGVAMEGGLTDKTAPNKTKIIRTHPDGRQETIVIDLNEVVKRGRRPRPRRSSRTTSSSFPSRTSKYLSLQSEFCVVPRVTHRGTVIASPSEDSEDTE